MQIEKRNLRIGRFKKCRITKFKKSGEFRYARISGVSNLLQPRAAWSPAGLWGSRWWPFLKIDSSCRKENKMNSFLCFYLWEKLLTWEIFKVTDFFFRGVGYAGFNRLMERDVGWRLISNTKVARMTAARRGSGINTAPSEMTFAMNSQPHGCDFSLHGAGKTT